jgi:3-hydroxybutyrate dehydrogenase
VEKQISDQARLHGIPAEQVITDIMLTEPAIKRLIGPMLVARHSRRPGCGAMVRT